MITQTQKSRSGKGNHWAMFSNGWTVETWWNRSARVWTTEIKDAGGYTRNVNDLSLGGELAEHALTAKWAEMNHAEAVALVIEKGELQTDFTPSVREPVLKLRTHGKITY
jgi:hypothetical protein